MVENWKGAIATILAKMLVHGEMIIGVKHDIGHDSFSILQGLFLLAKLTNIDRILRKYYSVKDHVKIENSQKVASLISVEIGAVIEIVKSGGSEQTVILIAKNAMYIT